MARLRSPVPEPIPASTLPSQRWITIQRARTAAEAAYARGIAEGTIDYDLTVFTTLFGRTDHLYPPLTSNPRIRYCCFTDYQHTQAIPAPYLPIYVDSSRLGPALTSRQIKILADHPALDDPDVTLWHDAAYEILVDPYAVAKLALRGDDILAMRHPHRSSIVDEAAVIARLGYMPADVLARQVAAYRAAGFVDQQRCITSTGYCIRRMSEPVRAFNRRWWAEVERWGWRDQMSIDYALWHTNLRVTYISGHYRDNPYAQWYGPDGLPGRRRRADYTDVGSAGGHQPARELPDTANSSPADDPASPMAVDSGG
jgi:hypothetical protein